MTAFNYQALDTHGKRQNGVYEADSARQVRQKLRDQGWMPLDVLPVADSLKTSGGFSFAKFKNLFAKRMSSRELALVTRQLATLLSAGIPLDDALTAVANQSEKPHVKRIVLGVCSKVLEGHSLANSMEEFPSAFPILYRTTVASGEKSGKLDFVLIKLAEYSENQHTIRRKIFQALMYPSLMTTVSICIVIFLLIYIVPKIVDVFTQTQQTLPLPTLLLIALSQFIKNYGLYMLLGVMLTIYTFKRLLKRPSIKTLYDRFLLKIPILGKNIRSINTARFARTFGVLISAGVPVLDAMRAASLLINSLPMKKALESSIDHVREGMNIHRALQQTGYFSPMFVHLVASGESSGQLEAMLSRAAQQQESDVEAVIHNSLTLFEPMLILVMGGVVLFIVLAVLLPIFALDQISG